MEQMHLGMFSCRLRYCSYNTTIIHPQHNTLTIIQINPLTQQHIHILPINFTHFHPAYLLSAAAETHSAEELSFSAATETHSAEVLSLSAAAETHSAEVLLLSTAAETYSAKVLILSAVAKTYSVYI